MVSAQNAASDASNHEENSDDGDCEVLGTKRFAYFFAPGLLARVFAIIQYSTAELRDMPHSNRPLSAAVGFYEEAVETIGGRWDDQRHPILQVPRLQ